MNQRAAYFAKQDQQFLVEDDTIRSMNCPDAMARTIR